MCLMPLSHLLFFCAKAKRSVEGVCVRVCGHVCVCACVWCVVVCVCWCVCASVVVHLCVCICVCASVCVCMGGVPANYVNFLPVLAVTIVFFIPTNSSIENYT